MSAKYSAQLLILSLLWGGSFLCVEIALGGLPALAIVWCRVALAALSTALAYLILAAAGAAKLLLVTFLIPISATILGVAFLCENLLPQQLLGFGLISLCLVAIDGLVLRKGVM